MGVQYLRIKLKHSRESKNRGLIATVEKVLKQILGGDEQKNDFTECATINDLTIIVRPLKIKH